MNDGASLKNTSRDDILGGGGGGGGDGYMERKNEGGGKELKTLMVKWSLCSLLLCMHQSIHYSSTKLPFEP